MTIPEAAKLMDRRKLLLWAQALESGNYAQGEARLVTVDRGSSTYCCLGVLCRVAIEDGLGLVTRNEDREGNVYAVGFGESQEYAYLPVEVSRWLAAEGVEPDFSASATHGASADVFRNPVVGNLVDFDGPITATQANDVHKFSFNRIAAMLREFYQLDELEGQSADGVGPS